MRNLILILIASLFATGMFAQGKACKGKKNPEMKAELKAYKEKNMTPVLKKYHDKMDASFNKSDYKQVKALRAKANELKEENKALKSKIRSEMQNADDKAGIKEQFSAQFQANREKKHAISNELKPILERNQEMLKGIANELKPYKETWRTETKAIMSKYMTAEEMEQCSSRKGKGHGMKPGCSKDGASKCEGAGKQGKRPQMQGQRPQRQGNRPEMQGQRPDRAKRGEHHMKRKMVKFVLWDGESRNIEIEDTGFNLEDRNDRPTLSKNFPNPAIDQTTVTFDLPKDSDNVTLTVSDVQGKVLRRYNYQNLTAGKQSIDLNLRGLSSGNYFYTISGNGIKETKKLVVTK